MNRVRPRCLPRAVAILALASTLALAGCASLGSALYFLQPRQWQPPEFEFTGGRLAVLIEPARNDFDNPLFSFAVQEKLTEILRLQRVNIDVLAPEELRRLQQANVDFPRWSLQRVGREANCNYVLYIRLRDLVLTERGDSPIISPLADFTAKLIGVDDPDDKAVLWPSSPQEREGRAFRVNRPPTERGGPETVDREARALAHDAARRIAKVFYKHDAEEREKPEQ